MKQAAPATIFAVALLVIVLPLTSIAAAQSPTAIPHLDLNKFTGTWYVIARLPISREKSCLTDEMVLYALGDKPNSFQVVTSCRIKGGDTDSWNAKGSADPAADGRLKLSRWLILHTKSWVFALDPTYAWALVGNPNHSSLYILSRTTSLQPSVLTQIESKAASQGFNASKLIQIPQH